MSIGSAWSRSLGKMRAGAKFNKEAPPPVESSLTMTQILQLRSIFEQFEACDGLDEDQFVELAGPVIGAWLNEKQLRLWFQRIDHNANGSVDWGEFMNHLTVESADESDHNRKQRDYVVAPDQEETDFSQAHKGRVTRLLCEGKNKYFTTDEYGAIKQWSSYDNSLVATFPTTSVAAITDALLVEDGNFLVTSSVDRHINVWKVNSKQLIRKYVGTSNLRALMGEALGKKQSQYGPTRGPAPKSYAVLATYQVRAMIDPPSALTCISSEDDTHQHHIVVGNHDGTLFYLPLLNLHKYKFCSSVTILEGVNMFPLHSDCITQVKWIPDIHNLLTASWDHRLALSDPGDFLSCASVDEGSIGAAAVASGATAGAPVNRGAPRIIRWLNADGHERPILTVDWNSSHRMIASGGGDSEVLIWNPWIKRPLSRLSAPTCPNYVKVQFNEADNQLIGLGGDGMVKVWDLRTYKLFQELSLDIFQAASTAEGGSNTTMANATKPAHTSTVSGVGEDKGKVSNSDQKSSGGSSGITSLGYDKTAQRIVACNSQPHSWVLRRVLYTYDTVYSGHTDSLIGCIYNEPFDQIITVDISAVIVWDCANGKKAGSFSLKEANISSYNLDANCRRLLLGCSSGDVCMWNFLSGQQLKKMKNIVSSKEVGNGKADTEIMHLCHVCRDAQGIRYIFGCTRTTIYKWVEGDGFVDTLDSYQELPEGQHITCMLYCPPLTIAVGTSDGYVSLYNIHSLSLTVALSKSATVYGGTKNSTATHNFKAKQVRKRSVSYKDHRQATSPNSGDSNSYEGDSDTSDNDNDTIDEHNSNSNCSPREKDKGASASPFSPSNSSCSPKSKLNVHIPKDPSTPQGKLTKEEGSWLPGTPEYFKDSSPTASPVGGGRNSTTRSDKAVESVVFLQNLEVVAAVMGDAWIHFWDSRNGQKLYSHDAEYFEAQGMYLIATDKLNKVLIASDDEGYVFVFDITKFPQRHAMDPGTPTTASPASLGHFLNAGLNQNDGKGGGVHRNLYVNTGNDVNGSMYFGGRDSLGVSRLHVKLKHWFVAHPQSLLSLQHIDEHNLILTSCEKQIAVRLFTQTGVLIGQFGQPATWNVQVPDSWTSKAPNFARLPMSTPKSKPGTSPLRPQQPQPPMKQRVMVRDPNTDAKLQHKTNSPVGMTDSPKPGKAKKDKRFSKKDKRKESSNPSKSASFSLHPNNLPKSKKHSSPTTSLTPPHGQPLQQQGDTTTSEDEDDQERASLSYTGDHSTVSPPGNINNTFITTVEIVDPTVDSTDESTPKQSNLNRSVSTTSHTSHCASLQPSHWADTTMSSTNLQELPNIPLRQLIRASYTTTKRKRGDKQEYTEVLREKAEALQVGRSGAVSAPLPKLKRESSGNEASDEHKDKNETIRQGRNKHMRKKRDEPPKHSQSLLDKAMRYDVPIVLPPPPEERIHFSLHELLWCTDDPVLAKRLRKMQTMAERKEPQKVEITMAPGQVGTECDGSQKVMVYHKQDYDRMKNEEGYKATPIHATYLDPTTNTLIPLQHANKPSDVTSDEDDDENEHNSKAQHEALAKLIGGETNISADQRRWFTKFAGRVYRHVQEASNERKIQLLSQHTSLVGAAATASGGAKNNNLLEGVEASSLAAQNYISQKMNQKQNNLLAMPPAALRNALAGERSYISQVFVNHSSGERSDTPSTAPQGNTANTTHDKEFNTTTTTLDSTTMGNGGVDPRDAYRDFQKRRAVSVGHLIQECRKGGYQQWSGRAISLLPLQHMNKVQQPNKKWPERDTKKKTKKGAKQLLTSSSRA